KLGRTTRRGVLRTTPVGDKIAIIKTPLLYFWAVRSAGGGCAAPGLPVGAHRARLRAYGLRTVSYRVCRVPSACARSRSGAVSWCMGHRHYDTDLTDEQFALIEPFLPRPNRMGRPPADLRAVLDAVFYLVRQALSTRQSDQGNHRSGSPVNRILLRGRRSTGRRSDRYAQGPVQTSFAAKRVL